MATHHAEFVGRCPRRDFASPCEFPDKLKVEIPAADDDLTKSQGCWIHITPDELVHAHALPVARDISQRESEDCRAGWGFGLG